MFTKAVNIAQNNLGEESEDGETVVHFNYNGEGGQSKDLLKSHHCDERQICMVNKYIFLWYKYYMVTVQALREKGLCGTKQLKCETNHNCEDKECK